MKTIRKETEIATSKENVWTVLLEDVHQRDWLSNFGKGMHAESDWIQGNKIVYKDDSGMGVYGKILEKRPYELLSIQYDGTMTNDVADKDDQSDQMNGAKEIFELSEQNGVTKLLVVSDINDEYFDQMNASWDDAIERIKELAQAI